MARSRRSKRKEESGCGRTFQFLIFVAVCILVTESADVGISAMFGPETSRDDAYRTIIQDGVRYVNRNTTFLSEVHTLVFVEAGNERPSNSVYVALQEGCDHVATSQVSALIMPRDRCSESDDIAGVLSHATNPVFSIDQGNYGSGSIAFKMHPSPEDMTHFYIDILTYFNWMNFTLLYDDGGAFANMEGVMEHATMSKWNISTIVIDEEFANIVPLIEERGSKNIFIYCSSELMLRSTIDQALLLGIIGPEYTWMIGNLDMAMDRAFMEILEDSNAYITRFNMNYTREHQYALPTARNVPTGEWHFRERNAFDAVIAVGHGLMLYRQERIRRGATGSSVLPGDTPMPACPTSASTVAENELSLYLREISFEGITGNVAFDEYGNRVNYTITIRSGQGETIDQIRGDWTQNVDYWEDRWDRKWENEGRLNVTTFNYGNDRKIKVVSIEAEPFLFLREKRAAELARLNYRQSTYTGNDRYEGYIMDLLSRIKSNMRGIDFDYEVELVPDGKYGNKDVFSQEWDGMIGEVVRRKADIAAGPLTVTDEREEDVDFTYSFMSGGVKLLLKNPYTVNHYVFRLMYPYGIEVWFINFIVFCLVALLLFLFNYFDPYEWQAAAERGETFEENGKNFNLKNSFWFCATTMFMQSYDNSPRSNAGRTLTAFWWVFALVMVFLYLFNLTYFINTNKRLVYVRTPNDLLNQHDTDFGTVDDGSIYWYLYKSSIPEYNRIWQRMYSSNPSVFVSNVTEGVERVRDSNGMYAFLGEAGELDYHASKPPCNLIVSGGYLVRTTYALAVQTNSPLRDQLSYAIETLRDSGVLEDLQREWWEMDVPRRRCANLTTWERQGVFSFTVNDLQGVYFMLLLGFLICFLVFIIEIIVFAVCGGKSSGGSGNRGGGKKAGRTGGGSSGPVGGGQPISGGTSGGDGKEKMWI
ncbi:glutamate receptor 3-like [Diadema antillarum]|uniref:glutamate receptor 3-like n=1 Tax=Diadema antillarum TaxID=105358 RepID=UPI003A8C4D1D